MVTCAMTALAMVFSVQQGEHGPLVVYKLKVPGESAAGATVAPAGHSHVLPSRAPKVLGRVAMPPAAPSEPAASGVSVLDIVEQIAPRQVPAQAGPGWNGEAGITLDQVNNDIIWRRETAERLPDLPFSPRF